MGPHQTTRDEMSLAESKEVKGNKMKRLLILTRILAALAGGAVILYGAKGWRLRPFRLQP